MICRHETHCGSCSFLEEALPLQRDKKLNRIKSFASGAKVHALDGPHLNFRDRTDLTVTDGKCGFYDRTRSIFSVDQCEMFTPELDQIFKEFKKNLPNIKKGSVRLRTGFTGEKGLWLDFANIDIKNLLDQKTWLQHIMALGFEVEIGQKNKKLIETDLGLKLRDPVMAPWFSTLKNNHEVALNCYVSSFTQPSRAWNKILIEYFLSQLSQKQSWLEVGAGIGNFTLPLLARGDELTAIEVDTPAIACLKANVPEAQVIQKDFLKADLTDLKFDSIFCDPPRSGLGEFVEKIKALRPARIYYLSCDFETWQRDCAGLAPLYALKSATLVDQFPHTPRMEILSELRPT